MPVDRSRLPVPTEDTSFKFPEIRRHTLPNGVRAWTISHRAIPLVSFQALTPAGFANDPRPRHGLAALTGDLLDEGCGDLDALGFHEAVGRIGGQAETEVGADSTLIGITALARFSSGAVRLLSDMLRRPRLDRADFERVRELRLARLQQIRENPPALADRAFTSLLFGEDHPYGHLSIGNESSLRATTLEDVRAFHETTFAPAQTTIVAAGDASHEALADLVASAFTDWSGSGTDVPARVAPDALADPARRLAVLHRAGAAQSELRIGHLAVSRSTPDYHALVVLNMVLGGQFVSRINLNLRARKGYTYGARTWFEFRRSRGPFLLQASVQSDATVDAIRESFAEIDAIREARPVTREELDTGRAALTRGYPRNFETAEQISRGAAQLALYGLPDDYFSTFVPRVLAVTEAELTRVAKAHLDSTRALTVIVGDRDRMKDLPSLGLGEPLEIVA